MYVGRFLGADLANHAISLATGDSEVGCFGDVNRVGHLGTTVDFLPLLFRAAQWR